MTREETAIYNKGYRDCRCMARICNALAVALTAVSILSIMILATRWQQGERRDEDARLQACSAGQTIPCERAVMDGTFYTRIRLYRFAYRLSTGHDLPEIK